MNGSTNWHPVRLVAAGALIWCTLVALRLSLVPFDWWRWRDDAVITLSHARNLVDFQSIGVSPGGNRVEGFSTPLQFALAVVFFAVTDAGYGAFLDLQVVVCIGSFGAITALMIDSLLTGRVEPNRRRLLLALLLSAAAALATCMSWSATGWLVSGMENPLVLTTGGLAILLARGPKVSTWHAAGTGIALALLGLTRIEFAVLMLPTLAATAWIAYHWSERGKRMNVALVLGIPGVTWALTHAARLTYFGELLPNTALAQGKTGDLPKLLWLGSLTLLFIAFGWTVQRSNVTTRGRAWLAVSAAFLGGATLIGLGKAVGHVPLPASWTNAGVGPVIYVCALIGAFAGIMARTDRGPVMSWYLVPGSMLFVPIAQGLVMGPARMEPFRVVSIAIPFAALLVAQAAALLLSERREGPVFPGARSFAPPALLSLMLLAAASVSDNARDMPWRITPYDERIIAVADRVRQTELGGEALPLVANPDLGKLSFRKRSVQIDLGRLGDPLLARLAQRDPDLVIPYLNLVAVPDVVEVHAYWSCGYSEWLQSDGFASNWQVASTWDDEGEPEPQCPMNGRFTIWTRTAAEEEYALTRAIADSPSPLKLIEEAVRSCVRAGVDQLRCEWVRRSVGRNAQTLRDEGLLEYAATALAPTPSGKLDRELLLQRAGWADRAHAYFIELAP